MNGEDKIKNIRFAVLATDVVCFRVIDNQLCVLIGKAPETSPFPGKWALVGGMIRAEEMAEDAVSRLLKDKAGIANIYTEQLYTFTQVNRDPRGRVVSVAYIALTHIDPQTLGTGRMDTKWYPVLDLPKLAYDHNDIVAVAYARLKSRIQYTNIAQHLLPTEFTLSELQSTYESVIGEKLDKRNFRKKILSSGMIKDTKRTKKQGVMRPAAVYIFTSKKIHVSENL